MAVKEVFHSLPLLFQEDYELANDLQKIDAAGKLPAM